eukprot:scaffold3304_cov154-Amphora_coffeaeformis.AAC.11
MDRVLLERRGFLCLTVVEYDWTTIGLFSVARRNSSLFVEPTKTKCECAGQQHHRFSAGKRNGYFEIVCAERKERCETTRAPCAFSRAETVTGVWACPTRVFEWRKINSVNHLNLTAA